MKNIVYEVRIVKMDAQFSTSISDETSGYVSNSEAKKIYKKWRERLKNAPIKENCYICIESFLLDDEGFVEMWLNQTNVKEFRITA